MPDVALLQIAHEYAEVFNRAEPAVVERLIAEACIEPFWDERTNLLAMLADGPEDLGLVLSSEPGGGDYLVVRYVGEWVVDTTPVDWEALEEEAFEPAQSWPDAARRVGWPDDDGF